MKNMKGKILVILLISCTTGVGSFYITRSLEEAKDINPDKTVKQWLDLSEKQQQNLSQSMTDFRSTADFLALQYHNQRQSLVQLMNDTQSTDQQILDQIDQVIQANEQLFRQVVDYVLSVRRQLYPQQHQRLMQLCRKMISGQVDRQLFRGRNYNQDRGPQGRRGYNRPPRGNYPPLGPDRNRRQGRNTEQNIDPGSRMDRGPGRGPGRDMGPPRQTRQGQELNQRRGSGQRRGLESGPGRGPGQSRDRGSGLGQVDQTRNRIRGNFDRRLGFDPGQRQIINQLDPEFNQDTFLMSRRLKDEYHQLALLLEKPDTLDNVVRQHLENLIQLRSELDHRIARHVLLIRPHLTPQQLKILISLSNFLN